MVLLNRPASAQTVMLQPAGSSGPDPFTPPAHTAVSASPTATAPHSAAPVPTGATTSSANGVHTVSGTAVGLYGGTERLSSCDVPQMSAFLRANPAKGDAWAGVEGISPGQIDPFLRSLTPVLLRTDTRVTNHGFANGAATSFQSVLQAGTAVLVDANGAPRARCACGNPLLAPVVTTSSSYTGTSWSTFNAQNVTVILPSVTTVQVFVLYDPITGQWFQRPTGSRGGTDVTVPAPVIGTGAPSGSASASPKGSATASSTCLSGSPAAPGSGSPFAPGGGQAQPCPSGSSPTPASSSPTSGSPSTSASPSPSASASPSASVSAPPSNPSPSAAGTGTSTGSGGVPSASGPLTVTSAATQS